MASNAAETLIGAAVLVLAGGFIVYGAQNANVGSVGSGYYDVKAGFRKASGISSGADVRVSGVKVGSVSGLELDTESYRAIASLSICEDVQLPDDSVVTITSDGLLGGSYIAIDPGASDFFTEPGGELTNTQGSVDLIEMLSKAVAGN